MTREQVQDLLAMIQSTYPNYNPPSKTAAVNAWTMALEDYNANDVAIAFKMYMKTNKSGFAPVPGQLIDNIQIIKTPQELNEMEAWALVSKAIRNSGYNSVDEYAKLPILVQKAVGLPDQLRIWAIDENYNEEVVMSQFQRCYRTECARQYEFQKFPIEAQKSIENNDESSYKAQIQAKRDVAIKSYLEAKKPLKIENKSIGLPKNIEERLKELKSI